VGIVKFASVTILAVAASLLAGCQGPLTVEQARALCTQKGGELTVFYAQEITRSGTNKPPVESPGDCITPDKFGVPPSLPGPAGVPSSN
jgi:hypothetical protein